MNRFFIIGNPRSGTTLFRLMLNKHTKVSVPPEAGFLVWLYNNFYESDFSNGYVPFLSALEATSKIETWQLDYKELEKFLLEKKPKTFSAVMDTIYQFYSQFVLKKDVSVYGDKNNYYLRHIELLSKLYPQAKFIHIVRDGRSVAASYKGVMEKNITSKYAPNLPTSIEGIAKEWSSNLKMIEDAFATLPNEFKFTVRYEDIVLNTNKTLTKVSKFLGISFEEEMLEYYKTNEQEGLEPKEYMEWKSKNLQPIQKNEAEKYKLLSFDDRNNFEKEAEFYLSKYNYQ